MTYLYLFSLVVGGVLLGASLLLGGHSDTEAHPDAPTPASADDPQGIESLLFSLFSVRFWTFFLAFFGLTGVLLTALTDVPRWAIAILAVLMGLGTAGFAAFVFGRLGAEGTNSSASSADYVGKTGRLLVGCGPDTIGKLRLEIRGSTIDVLCVAIDARTYAVHEEVIVVEMDGLRAKVARTRTTQA